MVWMNRIATLFLLALFVCHVHAQVQVTGSTIIQGSPPGTQGCERRFCHAAPVL